MTQFKKLQIGLGQHEIATLEEQEKQEMGAIRGIGVIGGAFWIKIEWNQVVGIC